VWRREASVIYPPVDVDTFHWERAEDYFLIVSEMVAYKQLAYAVRCFSATGRKLRVVGDGPEYRTLRSLSGPSVEFCGRVSDEQLQGLYAHARALVVPGEEDFGIATVEALASGKPIVALGRGGSVEIVPSDIPCGILYDQPTEEGLEEALAKFDETEEQVDPHQLRSWAARFSEPVFRREMRSLLLDSTASRLTGYGKRPPGIRSVGVAAR
jgi:glycosyltransferase involved in cell wall biosynthesis